MLKVERIDHGVRCVEERQARRAAGAPARAADSVPLSNVKLCVFGSMAEHNLPALLDAGLCVTVNSDDPAYFGGYVNRNFLASSRPSRSSAANRR
ncbi:MAG: hypothetical protein U1F67_26015 [Rubrivivax sp.]